MGNRRYRTLLHEYADHYAQFMIFRREGGILEVRLHTRGGPLQCPPAAHCGVPAALGDIDNDPENEVLILTGTGNSFLTGGRADAGNQVRLLQALINLRIPVITAVNGPMAAHAPLAFLSDVVLASEHTVFGAALPTDGSVPPDLIARAVLNRLLGPGREEQSMLQAQTIGALDAMRLGLIKEVLRRDLLLHRAWDIAQAHWMGRSRAQRARMRALAMKPWRELFASPC